MGRAALFQPGLDGRLLSATSVKVGEGSERRSVDGAGHVVFAEPTAQLLHRN